ncbi:MAG: LPS-assembly protein LptD [Bacteroidales bacterium]|nr:LPS-assembly protein LptD [Bacteroidales bacterium]
MRWLITLILVVTALMPVIAGNIIPDTLVNIPPDTIVSNAPDTLIVSRDSIPLNKGGKNKTVLDGKIEYAAADSLSFDIQKKMAYMYGDAVIKYQDITLKAAVIILDFNRNIVTANAITDSTGKKIGIPDFTQGTLNFKSNSLTYNFTSRKGLIKEVITEEGGGYLHASVIKKLDNNVSETGSGMFTTCDLEHPHFAIKYTRAKVMPGDKIVTGPAFLSIEDIPLPLVLPFGLFPNKKGRSSGIMIPRYGESANRGFYLEDGGYYFGLSDHFDLKLLGDIYSRGSWAIKPNVTYKKRYKYTGSFSIKYATNVLGVRGTPDYQKNKDFFINWSHQQDPKARPNGRFTASVQAGSSKFNSYNPATVSDYLNNSFSSSISYDMKVGQNANLVASARHSQNTSTRDVTISLPEVSFGFNRFYPFKKKVQTGKPGWYESISVTYNMNMKNEITAKDTMLFKPESLNRFVSGMKHTIPVSGSFKILKYFTWSHGINYTERWYPKTLNKTWIGDSTVVNGDTLAPHVQVDTVSGFKAARDYSYNSSISTTVYGQKRFTKGPVIAIRHVMRPSVGFSYQPDFGRSQLGYYKTVQIDTLGNTQKYSIFGDGTYLRTLYGYPGSGKSGALNFSLSNNLEMKVKSKKDTITGEKKVMLIDNLSLSSSYDLARDSMRWSNLNVAARTTLFKKVQISYGAGFSPYAVNDKGVAYNKFEWDVSKKPFRFLNSNWNLSVGYEIKSKSAKPSPAPPANANPEEMEDILANPDQFIDWNNPWNISFNYNFRYNSINLITGVRQRKVVQTFQVSGVLNVTEKWRIQAQTGYDFENKNFAFTQFTIYRNLHCWEMRFNWVPYGFQKSWNFQINVKSAVLQDLKLTKKKDFRDNL